MTLSDHLDNRNVVNYDYVYFLWHILNTMFYCRLIDFVNIQIFQIKRARPATVLLGMIQSNCGPTHWVCQM